MTPPSPNLMILEQHPYLQNRNRKLLKLCIMKEKSNAGRKKSFVQHKNSCGNTTSMNNILPKLEHSNLSQVESQRDDSDEESYDTVAHDVFQLQDQKSRSLGSQISNNLQKDILNLKEIKESSLILNFKTIIEAVSDPANVENQNENAKVLVIGPKPNSMQIPQTQLLDFCHNNLSKQFLSGQPLQQNTISNRQVYSYQIANQINAETYLQNVQLSGRSQSNVTRIQSSIKTNEANSPIKKIDRPKPKMSFMEFYKAAPVKNPTNILEKYIKRKK